MPHSTSAPNFFSPIFFTFPEQRRQTFSPKFDVYETSTNYILEGELSGLDKSNLNIEFTDPVTLVIKGKIEKSKIVEPENPTTPKSGSRSPSPARSLKATVEDENEEGTVVVEKKKAPVEKKEFKARQWVNERTVGSFHRTFEFPAGIDQDGVTAGLEFGVLKVVVPKKAPVSKKIEIL